MSERLQVTAPDGVRGADVSSSTGRDSPGTGRPPASSRATAPTASRCPSPSPRTACPSSTAASSSPSPTSAAAGDLGQALARRRAHDEQEEHVHRLHRVRRAPGEGAIHAPSERLVIEGGSAGGLLMGAVVNMRPDLFGAVISKVPFVDVINTMLDETLPLTVGEFEEWGNPKKKDEYDYIKSYCPYTNLEAKAYPAMLVKTSFNDSQVMYWEPAKYVAKLRTLKTDEPRPAAQDEHGGGPRRRLGSLRLPARDRVRLRVRAVCSSASGSSRAMDTLRSYWGGRWVDAKGSLETLVNPATEEPLARVAHEGIDRRAGLDFARRTGRSGPPRPDLRRAGRAPQGHVRPDPGASRRAPGPGRGQRRQHAERRQVRRGRRHLHALGLRGAGQGASGDAKHPRGRRGRHARALAPLPRPAPLGLRATASPSTSTPSTSRPGASPRRRRWRCSPGCRS